MSMRKPINPIPIQLILLVVWFKLRSSNCYLRLWNDAINLLTQQRMSSVLVLDMGLFKLLDLLLNCYHSEKQLFSDLNHYRW